MAKILLSLNKLLSKYSKVTEWLKANKLCLNIQKSQS